MKSLILALGLILGVTPKGIHQGIVPEDPQHTAVISYYTDSTHTPQVRVNDTVFVGYTNDGPELGESFYHHTVIRGLLPGEEYTAKLSDSTQVSLQPLQHNTPFTFTVFGDQGITRAAMEVARATAYATEAQIHFEVGDMSYANNHRFPDDPPGDEWWWQVWNTWFDINQQVAINKPFVAALGNHEYAEGWESNWEWEEESATSRLYMPDKYFLLINKPVAIFILDSNKLRSAYGRDQMLWVVDQLEALASNSNILWRIAMFHHPVYSAEGGRPGERLIREVFLPVFEAHGGDLVINGHHHIYSRSYPIFDGVPYMTDEPTEYINPPGPIHIVSGGGGQGLGDVTEKDYIVRGERLYHFLYGTISPDTLEISAYSRYGNLFDKVRIIKQ